MSSSTSCPEADWFSRHISIPGDPDTWQPVVKTRDQSQPLPMEYFSRSGYFCWGRADFLVKSDQTPGREASLIVYLQIPVAGTEGAPYRIRAKQASHENPPNRPFKELEAWRRLTRLETHVTSTLLGFKELSQGPEDPVPNGWAFYMLVSKPPGVQLGTLEGSEGIFWDFDSPTRTLIRAGLEEAYNLLYDAGVYHECVGPETLYWNAENSRLCLDGPFLPTGDIYAYRGIPFRNRMLSDYGLAKEPDFTRRCQMRLENPTIEDLRHAGWEF